MSEAVSALNAASATGGIADIHEAGLQGMITLRGDLASAKMKKAVKAAVGTAVPARRGILFKDGRGAAWMSPDELLLICAHADTDAVIGAVNDALAGEHAMVENVSDARALFSVTGAHAREVVAKLAPVDADPAVLKPGEIRRTRFAQVPAALWVEEDGSARIICFRSVAVYMFDLLKVAAQPGSEVQYF